MSRQLTARHSHRAWVSRGKLHVWGGCIEGQSHRFVMEPHGEEIKQLTKVVEVFDKGKREWTSVTTTGDDRPLGIRDAALALLGVDDTRAIVFGGYCGHGATCFHNSLHELDTKSYEWYVLIPDTKDLDGLAPMLKRNSGAVGFTRKGKKYVCVFGGVGLHGASQRQKNSQYHAEPRMAECTTNELHCAEITSHKAEWFWPDVTGSAPPPCADFSFIKTSDLEVVMMGGFAKTAYLHDSVYHLNLDNWEWSKIFTSPDVKRTRHFSTLLAPGKILMMGGADENEATRKDVCIIHVKTGRTETVLSEPKICKREWHSITAFPISSSGTSVSVVVTGGVTARDKEQDPTMWPKAETNFIMEFDLIEAQDVSEKWTLTRTTDLSTNISQQVQLQTLKKALHERDSKISQLESDCMGYKERIKNSDIKITELETQVQTLGKTSHEKDIRISELEKKVQSLERTSHKKDIRISELGQQLEKMTELAATKMSAVTRESVTQANYLALTGGTKVQAGSKRRQKDHKTSKGKDRQTKKKKFEDSDDDSSSSSESETSDSVLGSSQSQLQTHGMNFTVVKTRVLRRLCNDLRVVIEGDLENIRFELSAVDLIPLEVRDQRNAGVMVSTIEKKLVTDESVWDKLMEVLKSCNSQALAKKLSDQLMKELHK